MTDEPDKRSVGLTASGTERVATLSEFCLRIAEQKQSATPDGLLDMAMSLRDRVDAARSDIPNTPPAAVAWVRADENLVGALSALNSRPPRLEDAVLHLERSLSFLEDHYRAVVEQVRDIDRQRNRAEFMSG